MTTEKQIARILFALATILCCVIFGGSLFDFLVNEGNVTPSNYPDSVLLIRQFWVHKNPGDFFKPLTPAFLFIIIILLLLYWKYQAVRARLLAGIVFFLIVQVITFAYYFPQNQIIRTGTTADLNAIKDAYFGSRFYLDILRNALSLLCCIFVVSAYSVKS